MGTVSSMAMGGDFFPPDIKRIKDRGKIVVAQYDSNERGFFAFDDTKRHSTRHSLVYQGRTLVGCDIFLAKKIAHELGVELELDRSAQSFDSVCPLVASGQADIAVSKLSITLPRAQYVRFSDPYVILQTGILVNRLFASRAKEDADVIKLCNRPKTKVGVIWKSAYVHFAKRLFPKADLVFYKDFESMVKAVLSGEVQALYDERIGILYALNQDQSIALRFRFVPVCGLKDKLAIAVSPNSPNLLAFINVLLGLEEVKTELEYFLEPGAESGR